MAVNRINLNGAYYNAPQGTFLRVRLSPRSSREKIEGVVNNHLVVKVTAPPVEGKANKALIKLLAKCLKVAASRMELVRGEGSRNKVILIKDWLPPDGFN